MTTEKALLVDKLEIRTWGITLEEILNGCADRMVDSGLQAVFLCNDGTGRSRNAAEKLTTNGYPAARIVGGLRQISSEEFQNGWPMLKSCLNFLPNLSVILTHEEMYEYRYYLNQLRIFRFTDSESAAESVQRMIESPNR